MPEKPNNELVKVEVDSNFVRKNPKIIQKLSLHQLIYSIGGMVIGSLCILGGIYLFIRGISGKSRWTSKILVAENTITDAAPGAVLFIFGLLFVFVTRYVVKVNKKKVISSFQLD